MSRTFRRKNYEQETGKVAGSSICGYYTYRDWHFDQYGNFLSFLEYLQKRKLLKNSKKLTVMVWYTLELLLKKVEGKCKNNTVLLTIKSLLIL